MKATGFLPYLQTGWYDTDRAHLSLNSTSKETVISEQPYPQPVNPSPEPGDPSAICLSDTWTASFMKSSFEADVTIPSVQYLANPVR